MSCGAGHRCGSDPELLRLWCRPAAAVALIQPLAWELPYAAGAALKKKKNDLHMRLLAPILYLAEFQVKALKVIIT